MPRQETRQNESATRLFEDRGRGSSRFCHFRERFCTCAVTASREKGVSSERRLAALSGIAIAFFAVEVKLIASQERLAGELSLSRILRCIGQSLETLELKAFEIKSQSGAYLVQGIRKGTSSSVDVELRFTAEDIKRLESEARKKRRRTARRSNLLNLSQVLRMGGTYVEHVEGRFLKISWQVQSDKIQSITIQYEPHERERKKDEYSVSTIDEICVHVYKQRKRLPASFSKHAHGPSERGTGS
jgi:hypothetical protein